MRLCATSRATRIIFAGALFDEDKDAAYRNAYLFVLPSTIEGMALDAARSHELREVLRMQRHRREPGSHRAAAAGAVDAPKRRDSSGNGADRRPVQERGRRRPCENVAVPARRSRSSLDQAHARTHVAQHFDWDRIAGQYLALYDGLVQRGQ
jgi:glycosyltransferase involved in cell wall biosynthesis